MKSRALTLLLFAVAALVLFFLVRDVGWAGIGTRLRGADPGWVVAAVACNLATYVFWALRWRAVLRPVASVAFLPALRALLASVFVNTVVPFARSFGGLVRAGALAAQTGHPVGTLAGPTLLDQAGYSAMSVLLGLLTVPVAAWSFGGDKGDSGGSTASMALVAAALAGAGVVITIVLSSRTRRERIASPLLLWFRSRLPVLSGGVDGAAAAARTSSRSPSTWVAVPAGGLGVWGANVLAIVCAGRAIGAPIPLAAAAAAWSLGSMAGVASGTPGGAGTTEAVAIVPMIAMGVTRADALTTILLARGIQYAGAILLGGGSLVSLRSVFRPVRPRP